MHFQRASIRMWMWICVWVFFFCLSRLLSFKNDSSGSSRHIAQIITTSASAFTSAFYIHNKLKKKEQLQWIWTVNIYKPKMKTHKQKKSACHRHWNYFACVVYQYGDIKSLCQTQTYDFVGEQHIIAIALEIASNEHMFQSALSIMVWLATLRKMAYSLEIAQPIQI